VKNKDKNIVSKTIFFIIGILFLIFGWIFLLNKSVQIQEIGVFITIAGSLLAYFGLPNPDKNQIEEVGKNVLLFKNKILDNYFIKFGFLLIAVLLILTGNLIIKDPDYSTFSLFFYCAAVLAIFFALPLINIKEKKPGKIIFVLIALCLAFWGQYDFLKNKVNYAIIKYIIAAAVFIFASPLEHIKKTEEKDTIPLITEIIFLIIIIVIGIFLRTYELNIRPFGLEVDEPGLYLGRISNLIKTNSLINVGAFGLHTHILQLFDKFFGPWNRLSIKWMAVSIGIISIPAIYFLIRAILNQRIAMFATVVFTFLRWNLYFSRMGHAAVVTLLAIILFFYYFFKGIKKRKKFLWFLAGLSLGLAPHGVWTAVLLIISVVFYLGILIISEKKYIRNNIILVFAFLFGYWIFISMMAHNYFMDKNIYFGRISGVSVFNNDANNVNKNVAKEIISNLKSVLLMYNFKGDNNPAYSGAPPGEAMLDYVSSVLFGLGFLYAIYYSKYYLFFIFILAFFSQASGSIFSNHAPNGIRAIGTMIIVIFLISFIFNKIFLSIKNTIGKKLEYIYLPLLLSIFLIPIIKINYFQYFGRWVSLGPNDEIATATGMYTGKLGPGNRILLYTSRYYPDHPPYRFYSEDYPKVSSTSQLSRGLNNLMLINNENFAILFHSDTWANIDSFKNAYFPDAKIEIVDHKYFNPKLMEGEGFGIFAKALLISNEDIKKHRGLNARYSFDKTIKQNELPEFKNEDLSKVPYLVSWKGTILIPYYGIYKFTNTNNAKFSVIIDNKSVAANADVILAQGLHTISINSYRNSAGSKLNLQIDAEEINDKGAGKKEFLKSEEDLFYDYPIYGLHGYYYSGNEWAKGTIENESIDIDMAVIHAGCALWKGIINIPEDGKYIFRFEPNNNTYRRIIIDKSKFWETGQPPDAQKTVKYFSGRKLLRVNDFTLVKGKHPIEIYINKGDTSSLLWDGGNAKNEMKPVPVNAFEPDFEITPSKDLLHKISSKETNNINEKLVPGQPLPINVINTQFNPYIAPENISSAVISKYELKRIDTGVKFRKPTDIAVTGDGQNMLIADSGADVLYLLTKENEEKYKLKTMIRVRPEKNGIIKLMDLIFGWYKKAGHAYLYADFNENGRTIYVLDGDYGTVKEFDYDGKYVRTIVDSPSFVNAASVKVSKNSDMAGLSIPMLNAVVTFDSQAMIIDNYATTTGNGLGQLSHPGFIGFDPKGNRFVADIDNSRMQMFDNNMNYVSSYYIGRGISTMGMPQAVVIDNASEPYMVVNNNEKKALMVFTLNKKIVKSLNVNNYCLAADDAANLYTIDTSNPRDIFISRIKILEDIAADVK